MPPGRETACGPHSVQAPVRLGLNSPGSSGLDLDLLAGLSGITFTTFVLAGGCTDEELRDELPELDVDAAPCSATPLPPLLLGGRRHWSRGVQHSSPSPGPASASAPPRKPPLPAAVLPPAASQPSPAAAVGRELACSLERTGRWRGAGSSYWGLGATRLFFCFWAPPFKRVPPRCVEP